MDTLKYGQVNLVNYCFSTVRRLLGMVSPRKQRPTVEVLQHDVQEHSSLYIDEIDGQSELLTRETVL